MQSGNLSTNNSTIIQPLKKDILFLEKVLEKILGNVWETIDKSMAEMILRRLEWSQLPSGELLYQQGEIGDCMHVLVSGRLKMEMNKDGKEISLGEVTSGEAIGQLSMITDERHRANIYAIRDSIVVKITKIQFDRLCAARPEMLKHFTKKVIHRLNHQASLRKQLARMQNIAFLPVSKGIDMETFMQKMQENHSKQGKILFLNGDNIGEHLAKVTLEDVPENSSTDLKLGHWLDEMEMEYDFILYQGNYDDDYWTKNCIRQADKIVLISNFYDFEKTEVEKRLLEGNSKITHVNKSLVLLHPNGDQLPSGTKQHLKIRQVARHHHIRWTHDGDFARLTRFLIGKAIGLVFAGGGAKGLAHIGVFRRMRELNMPIDFVAGTSMGAIIAGGLAQDWTPEKLFKEAKAAFVTDKPLKDRTIPIVSYYNGKKLDKVLKKHLGEANIEDQWINFFCVSSNLTTAGMVVHRQGKFWKAIRASMSIPGAFPPVVYQGDLLVDGGLMNNLPIDLMMETGVGKIIAVDLHSDKEYDLEFEEMPTSLQILKNKFTFGKNKIRVPTLMDIIAKSIVLANDEKSNNLRKLADWLLNPPVSHVGILDFRHFEEVVEIGYEYTKALLEERPELMKEFGERE